MESTPVNNINICVNNTNNGDIFGATCIDQLSPSDVCREKFGSEAWICAFSPDEEYFGWSCGNRQVVIIPWDKKHSSRCKSNGEERASQSCITVDANYSVWALAFGGGISNADRTPTQHWTRFNISDLILATGLSNGRIRIWHVYTGKLLNEVMDHKGVVGHLSFAPDFSFRLVSASSDCTLKVWDMMDDGNLVTTLKGHPKWVASCAWSPDSSLLASVGGGKAVFLWDTTTYTLRRRLVGHLHEVVSCAFSPDGALVATASWDTYVFLWDPHTGTIITSMGHCSPPPRPIYASGANGMWVRAVAFSPSGNYLSTVADDGFLRFWNVNDDSAPESMIPIASDAMCCCYSPSGLVLAVGHKQGVITLWSVPVELSSLQHLCRLAIRRNFPLSRLLTANMPQRIINFLRYKV